MKSDWVKYEFNNALRCVGKDTVTNIIPIHYRECDIPEILAYILNIDLTNGVVYLKNGELDLFGYNYS